VPLDGLDIHHEFRSPSPTCNHLWRIGTGCPGPAVAGMEAL
jgi:hypothetical protein